MPAVQRTNRISLITRCSFLAVLLISSSIGSALVAQNTYDLSQFGSETGTFFLRPLHWEGDDWLTLGLISGGTFLAMQADLPDRTIALNNSKYQQTAVIEGGRIWGESYVTPSLTILFMMHGWLTNDSVTKKLGFEIGQSALYAATITQVLSKAIGRARPNQNLGRAAYKPFTIFGEDYHSMPGGHSTAAFVLSTVLSRNLSSPFLKVIVYVPAVVTLVSRVSQDFHWTSDDLLGGAIGFFVADWVCNTHEQKESRVQLTSLYPLTLKIGLN